MTTYQKAPAAFIVTVACSIALGYAIYQNNFRAWTIVAFVFGGIVLGGLASAVIVISAEAEKELQDKRNNVSKAESSEQRDTFSMAAISMAKLDEYYVINKSQARWSFFASIVAVTAGLIVLVLTIEKASESSLKLISGSVSGVLLEFIGGGFFYIYDKSLKQMVLFYTNLVRLQDTMLAVQLCKELSDELAQASVMSSLIEKIMRRAMRTGSLDTQEARVHLEKRNQRPAPGRQKNGRKMQNRTTSKSDDFSLD